MVFTGVCLITEDVMQLANFYGWLFGVEVTGNEIHAEVKGRDLDLAFFRKSSMEEMAAGSTASSGPGCFTLSYRVDDLERELARVQAKGVQILKPIQNHPWGARSFWFRDPAGNILSFHSPA